jgi:hypothetical protein
MTLRLRVLSLRRPPQNAWGLGQLLYSMVSRDDPFRDGLRPDAACDHPDATFIMPSSRTCRVIRGVIRGLLRCDARDRMSLEHAHIALVAALVDAHGGLPSLVSH